MSRAIQSRYLAPALAYASVLSGALLIPAVRPFMARVAPGNEGAAHAFMALNMLGAVIAAPVIAKLSSTTNRNGELIARLALLDAALLLLLATGPSLHVTLALRTMQGALNVGALSVLLGTAPRGATTTRGSRYGLLGTAMMLGVASGAPLGTLCLRWGPTAPLVAAALLELSVCWGISRLPLEPALRGAERALLRDLPWQAMAWVFSERFAVGLFVVTFSFHVRECLGAAQSTVGWLLSAFMLPFCVAVYPMGQCSDRFGSRAIAVLGLFVYGLGFLALPNADVRQLAGLMAVLGLSSAAVFASALRECAASVAPQERVTAMSALNSAGSLGMLLGTATAGITTAAFRVHGLGIPNAHALVFRIGGATQLCVAAASVSAALVMQRMRAQAGVKWQKS